MSRVIENPGPPLAQEAENMPATVYLPLTEREYERLLRAQKEWGVPVSVMLRHWVLPYLDRYYASRDA